jgi:RimJ/RimL family protein N-acetyltransferase
MELIPFTEADEWLTVALETDPRVMAELGGPWSPEEARATHARRLKSAAEQGSWGLKIVPDAETGPVGSLSLWHSEWDGQPLSEAGWMVLPQHQGRGHASAGLRLLLERAEADGRWGDIHAFPGATNAPSNALCRKLGFELVGGGEADYAGRRFPVNHWVWRARSVPAEG